MHFSRDISFESVKIYLLRRGVTLARCVCRNNSFNQTSTLSSLTSLLEAVCKEMSVFTEIAYAGAVII